MVKVISFDLDDTLSDSTFDTLIWDVEIPKAYAREKGITFKKAKIHVMKEYENLWGKVEGDWRDASFWLTHFKLNTTWNDLLSAVSHEIKHFSDVKPVLNTLKEQGFKLVLVTNANTKFLEAKLQAEDISEFFTKIYSVPSDFDKKHKDAEVFSKVLSDFDISASEIVHIGDNQEYDVKIPSSMGIKSFLIDRSGKNIVALKDLFEFKTRLDNLKK